MNICGDPDPSAIQERNRRNNLQFVSLIFLSHSLFFLILFLFLLSSSVSLSLSCSVIFFISPFDQKYQFLYSLKNMNNLGEWNRERGKGRKGESLRERSRGILIANSRSSQIQTYLQVIFPCQVYQESLFPRWKNSKREREVRRKRKKPRWERDDLFWRFPATLHISFPSSFVVSLPYTFSFKFLQFLSSFQFLSLSLSLSFSLSLPLSILKTLFTRQDHRLPVFVVRWWLMFPSAKKEKTSPKTIPLFLFFLFFFSFSLFASFFTHLNFLLLSSFSATTTIINKAPW